VQLGWNTLAAASSFIPQGAPSTGSKLVGFGGLARNVDGPRVAYARYGIDALRYFDLYAGDRVLILRGRLEGVVGAADDIPFMDLPRLGGPANLRGYDRDRFRDRVAVLGSIEYRYPIWRQVAGFLFVDAGRVLPALTTVRQAFTSPQDLRPGAGGGLEILQGDRFRLRGQVAGSPEGLFLQFTLDPVYRLATHNYRI
jgi:outer membrane translocation and assembly module TamA